MGRGGLSDHGEYGRIFTEYSRIGHRGFGFGAHSGGKGGMAMKKLLIACLCALMLCGCVGPKPEQTLPPTVPQTIPQTAEPEPVIPGPQEMPTQGGDYQLPPGEDKIPEQTHTH